jgi:mannose-1-phosphate guanylyltransferase
MKAMILAAGLGTRLLPLTAGVSKVSLPLAGVPVLVRVLRFLRGWGVDEFVVNLHHAPDTVKDCLSGFGEHAVFSFEDSILGTGGGLARAGNNFSGGTFLMVNGDCYYGGCPLGEALEFHKSRGAMATMVLVDMPEGERYGSVEVDAEGRLLRIAGRPEKNHTPAAGSLHFTGIHILEPEILSEFSGGGYDINRDIYPGLLEKGYPLYGFHTGFRWFDLGTPSRFLEAASSLLLTEETSGVTNGVLVGKDCRIDRSAVLEGPLELGAGTTLADGSRVSKSVLGARVTIGQGAVIEECFLGDGVQIESGAVLFRCVAAIVDGSMQIRQWEEKSAN